MTDNVWTHMYENTYLPLPSMFKLHTYRSLYAYTYRYLYIYLVIIYGREGILIP